MLKILVKDVPKRKNCRKFYKELRDNLSQEQVAAKSQVICRRVLESDEYKKAETIFAYYPLGNEVNCLPIIEQALKEEKQVVLPRTGCDCRMDFYEIHSLDDVEAGQFHVMEPKTECKQFLPQREKEESFDNRTCNRMLVLVPGLVFDRYGNRYGYGKGYYDRYFARFLHLKRMALAYTEQLSETPLECLDTDVRMHMITTEEEMFRTEAKK